MIAALDSTGAVKISAIGSAVPASAFYNGGLAFHPDGTLYVKQVVGALTGQWYNGGLATTFDGALYVTYASAASDVSIGGLRCRADGVVCVSAATVATRRSQGGLPTDDTGALVVGIPIAGQVAHFDANIGITSAASAVSQWNDLSGLGHHLLQASGANQPIYCPAGINNAGTAQAGSTGTTLNLATSALAYNSLYVGMTVTITAGTCAGQSRTITGYVGATKVATVAAWTGTPDNTSVYSISAAYASVFFDGAAHFMKCAAFTLNQPETVYLVCTPITWTASDYFFDGNAGGSMGLLQAVGTPKLQMYAGSFVADNADAALGSSCVIAAQFNGAGSSILVNAGTATTGNAGANNAGGFTLAARGDNAVNANIRVRHILIFNVAHDAATLANVIAALQSKWGIP